MKRIILVIGFAIILGVSYFFYDKYYIGHTKEIWDFVPENALVVYDMQGAVEIYNFLSKTGFGQGIRELDLWDEIAPIFSQSDTSKYNSSFVEKLKKIHLLVSVHAIAKEGIDFTYFIDVSKSNGSLIQEYINELVNDTNSSLTQRVYNNRNIFEIEGGTFQFSYFIEDGILVVSQTPFLIEDVIRTINSPEEGSYKSSHVKSLKANKLKNDQGDLYVNMRKLDDFLKVFGSKSNIGVLANSAFMDVKVTDNLVSLSGFAYSGSDDLLNIMKGQEPVKIHVSSYVPNIAYSVLHTGISDAELWYNNYQKQVEISDLFQEWDIKRMVEWIGEELVLVNLNTLNNDTHAKLLFIDTRDMNDALNQLNTLAENISKESQDSVFYEQYGGVLIKELLIPEFPEKIFGKWYNGFQVSYYAIIDNYIVLSSDVESMHILINSIEEEDTWGRTLTKSQWLLHTLEEANLSYFFDCSQATEPLKDVLNKTWEKHLESNEQVIKGVGMGAIQFSNIDGQFYTNMVLQYDLEKSVPVSLNFDVERATYLEHNAITKPFVVRNHNAPKIREVIIQDSLKNIYLIDHKGAIVWQDSIGQDIEGKIHQIDFYKNKKLQYLFGAGESIYLMDRNGNKVENYPIDVGFEVYQLSVIDYDHTKSYRILLADKRGSLYMYDKNGKNLDGWNPRKMEQPLVTSPRHIRVRGMDAIIVQSSEKVYVMNRKGEDFEGFPIVLENEISGDVHINVGRDFDHTIFSVVSKEGELVQFDLNGETINKKQFYKPTKDTFFELIEGVTKNDFVIMRQNAFRLSLLDASEKVIIEKDYLTSDLRKLQYYDLGGDNSVYVVNDFVQGFGYIYNNEGKLLNNVPINNEYEIGLLRNAGENKTYIYSVYKDQVSVYSY